MPKKKDKMEDKKVAKEEIRKVIGKQIKEMRNKLGSSALTVSEKLDLSREAITHIETGRNNISAVALWELATLFHCKVSDFFPDVPDGFALTQVDIRKIEQENPDAGKWAERLFKK